MAAYIIAQMTVKNAEKWAEYRSKVPATIVKSGGEVVFRGRRVAVLSGDFPYTDAVVIRFPSVEAITAWYNSADYQALIPIRQQGADMILISYEA